MQVQKRNGQIVEFNENKIRIAIEKAYKACGHIADYPYIEEVLDKVIEQFASKSFMTVEQIQDAVETTLFEFFPTVGDVGDMYSKYRAMQAMMRAEAMNSGLPSPMQQFQYYDKYSRYNHTLGRRETWPETVQRTVEYLREISQNKLDNSQYDLIYDSILNQDVMPSMRLFANAGSQAHKNGISIYNCSYLPIEDFVAFPEILYISMSGTGVGFSVEQQYVDAWPTVPTDIREENRNIFVIEDSSEGWYDAVYHLFDSIFNRNVYPTFDYSNIRPKGSILYTKGGTASGPEPLMQFMTYVKSVIRENEGQRLRSIDLYDIACRIGECAISGGHRRNAFICLFSENDEDMLSCKNMPWEELNSKYKHRFNSNNSMVITEQKDKAFFEKWFSVMEYGYGEPGIFSRYATLKNTPERRQKADFGINPCGEIILRPYQFCNLSIAVARPSDTIDSLYNKVVVATIIGTIQSMVDNFPKLRPIWRKNAQEERLLGVDITGQMDQELLEQPAILEYLRAAAVTVNKVIAQQLGINQSAAVSTVKPSGNSSVLLHVGAGMHPWWSKYYIRRARLNSFSPVANILRQSNVRLIPDNGEDATNPNKVVVEFYVKAPDGAKTRNDVDVKFMLSHWLKLKKNWTEHNPSVSIYYKPEDKEYIINWLYDNQESLGGLSFFPAQNHKFALSPYEEITKEEYDDRIDIPNINWALLAVYERFDKKGFDADCASGECVYV